MGSIHKLKPNVVDFILAEKEKNPSISCRKLVPLIRKQFGIDVSKSSVNSVLKQKASPVSAVALEVDQIMPNAGAYFLKGADTILGTTSAFAQAASASIKEFNPKFLHGFTQVLVFMRLLGISKPEELMDFFDPTLWILCDLDFSRTLPAKIIDFYKLLQDKSIYYDIALSLVSVYTGLPGFQAVLAHEETIDSELDNILLNLHLYVKSNFLPLNYQIYDFHQINKRVYSLEGVVSARKEQISVRLSHNMPLDYQFDITHTCNRFNAAKIISKTGQNIFIQPPI